MKWTPWFEIPHKHSEVCVCGLIVDKETKVKDGKLVQRSRPKKRSFNWKKWIAENVK